MKWTHCQSEVGVVSDVDMSKKVWYKKLLEVRIYVEEKIKLANDHYVVLPDQIN